MLTQSTANRGSDVLPITVDVDEYAEHHFDGTVSCTVKLPLWMDDAAMEQELDLSALLQDALGKLLSPTDDEKDP